jgi:hypothetical protein
MSWVLRMALVGSVAALVVAVIAAVEAGTKGLTAALVSGAVAAAAQFAAVALLRPAMQAETPKFLRRWVSGMAIRGAGALLVVGLALAARAALPPLWMAVGFLAVLLTLLYAETRFLA